LAQHGINQRGLAVVDVGDDGNVTNTWVQIDYSSKSLLKGLTTTLLCLDFITLRLRLAAVALGRVHK
jgi:hypothetical protein